MASCVTRTRIGQYLRLACPYSERRRQVWTDLGPAGFFQLVYQASVQWKSISCERHIDALQSRGSPRRGRHFLNLMNRVRSTFSFQKQKYCLFYDLYSIRGASWKTLLFCSRRAWLKKKCVSAGGLCFENIVSPSTQRNGKAIIQNWRSLDDTRVECQQPLMYATYTIHRYVSSSHNYAAVGSVWNQTSAFSRLLGTIEFHVSHLPTSLACTPAD